MCHFINFLKILLNRYANIYHEPIFVNPGINCGIQVNDPGLGKCNPEIYEL